MTTPATPSIDNLETTWASIDELCSALGEAEWSTPTGCPGWSVRDNLSHLVDYESMALGRARAEHTVGELGHVANALGASNEIGVDLRRGRSGDEVLAEFREVTASRSDQLRRLTAADLDDKIPTPAGEGTVADMLTLRVMDTWSHEQDIRRALGRPGHERGPVVDEALDYWSQFLGFVVGKRAGAPSGSTVQISAGDRRWMVHTVDGRASLVDAAPSDIDATLAMTATTFAAHVGGRSDAPDDAELSGDLDLARRVMDNLGFMP